MSDLRAYQPSFTSGELAPALFARTDLAKYATGLKKALNVFIHAHGGVSNRAGLEFVREVKSSTLGARLLSFSFNTDEEDNYILELGNLYMRFHKSTGTVMSGMSPYEIVTTYSIADVEGIVTAQEADVMFMVHGYYAPRKLARSGDASWAITTPSFTPAMATPTGLTAGAIHAPPSGETKSITFKVSSVASLGQESAASSTGFPDDPLVVSENMNGRVAHLEWDSETGAVLYRVYGAGGLLAETTENEIDLTSFTPDGARNAPGSADPGAPNTPSNPSAVIVYGPTTKYKVAAIDKSGEESLPSSSASIDNDLTYQGNRNTLSWSATTGAVRYVVYKSNGGGYGYVGTTTGTSFVDNNITADTSDGPQSANNPFTGDDNYPQTVTFFEQRLAMGGTLSDPAAVWLSQSANYENFGVSVRGAKASDSISFRIRARQANAIRAMLPAKGLMILTSGAEWIVSGGSEDFLSPTSIKIDNQGYRGAATVQPIVVGNVVLFAQRSGGVIRDFSYDFAQDSFTGQDLTILSRHLFEGRTIKAWAFAQSPDSIVWVVLDDGSCVSMTYMREHEVWGWTRHETDGVFEDVAVNIEDGEDVPYFIVARTGPGGTKRFIEKLHTRQFDVIDDAFFLDCAKTYFGAPTMTVTGLGHLEGRTVWALADGNVVTDLQVNSGSVTLSVAASTVHVGLPYDAIIQTLDLDLGQVKGLGTVQGRKKFVSQVTLRVEDTRGIKVGNTEATLTECKQLGLGAWDQAITPFTGIVDVTPYGDWNTGANVVVKQSYPLPMTIQAIMPDVKLSG